jgi:hypothetical protein
MAGFVRQQFRIQQPLVWLERLEALVARELAPSPRKICTAARISVIVARSRPGREARRVPRRLAPEVEAGQRGYRTTSCSVPSGCELEEDRANA